MPFFQFAFFIFSKKTLTGALTIYKGLIIHFKKQILFFQAFQMKLKYANGKKFHQKLLIV